MFYDIFKRQNVVKFFNDISKGEIYKQKDIPTSINNEIIDKNYYSILLGIDAIMKYVIVIEDMSWFDEYLNEVQLLLRKISKHNDIKIGIYKLIINYSKKKLKIKDFILDEDKEEVIRYIYNKYITEGYFFHSFPSIFIEDVKSDGLYAANYNFELDSLKEINSVFEKYKVSNVFTKKLETMNKICITDSPFMACFYAYNSPNFLKELSLGLIGKKDKCDLDSFFMKNYTLSRKNLVKYIKRVDMFNNDFNKVLDLFNKEWDLFKINESIPVIGMIKRSVFNENYLTNIDEIIESDIVDAVSKIFNVAYNQKEITTNVLASNINIVYLPTISELGFNILEKDKKNDSNSNNSFMDDYGSSTILALVGILLIMLGLLISIIMIGR